MDRAHIAIVGKFREFIAQTAKKKQKKHLAQNGEGIIIGQDREQVLKQCPGLLKTFGFKIFVSSVRNRSWN